jgi:UDP-N-acetylglucosamine--N-acetylmuramyl-(pentapeptide) pyrophosphoryl-undecaprenol N-acetylglucosamine transferase
VEPFLFEMAAEMRAADLIVCRAGAMTLAEIAAIGRPAVLIPLPTAADDHQRKNARALELAGAAEVVEEQDLADGRLVERVLALAADPDRRRRMASQAKALGRPDAAARVADRIVSLAGGR